MEVEICERSTTLRSAEPTQRDKRRPSPPRLGHAADSSGPSEPMANTADLQSMPQGQQVGSAGLDHRRAAYGSTWGTPLVIEMRRRKNDRLFG